MQRHLIAALVAVLAASPSAQSTGGKTHRLEATPKTVAYGYYWSEAQPVLRIASGDIIDVDTLLTNSPTRTRIIPLDRKTMTAAFAPGIVIPLHPFFGSMGVAPPPAAGRVSSTPPGTHAGNLDNRELVAGTSRSQFSRRKPLQPL